MADRVDYTKVVLELPHFENDVTELDFDAFDLTSFLEEEIDIAELELFLEGDDNLMEPSLSPDLADIELSSLFLYGVDEIKLSDLESLSSVVEGLGGRIVGVHPFREFGPSSGPIDFSFSYCGFSVRLA